MAKKEMVVGIVLGAALLAGFSAFGIAQDYETEGLGSPLRYEIWVELDDAQKTLRGREEIAWRNQTREPVPDMWFHLYYNAFKNEKSAYFEEQREENPSARRVEKGSWGWIDLKRIALADGTDLRPTLEFMTPDAPVHPEDETVARIAFPEPLQPGEEVRLKLEFEAKIPKTFNRSGYYKSSYFLAQWFPKPGVYEEGKGWNCHQYHFTSEFFADFADFKVHLTVPASFVVGASGKEVSAVRAEDGKTVTYTYEQARIHDFAWTADPDFLKIERAFVAANEVSPREYAETAALLNLPVEEVRLPDVRMILLIEPEHKSQVERHFRALRAALKYYGLWFGPYPYETVTMVDPPFRTRSGGMEYPTLFTAGTDVLLDKKVLSPEMVIIHEFGHGYWYGLAANNEFEEAWLDEGINTYSTGRVEARVYGRGMIPSSLFGFPLSRIINFPTYYDYELNRLGVLMAAERDPVTTPSWRFSSRISYALNVYQRASTCLETLERLLGEEKMLRAMRAFQMGFRFRHPRTQDFVRVVNEISGQDLSWFFEEFFFQTLNFDYGIGSLRSEEKKEVFPGIFDKEGKKVEVTAEDAAEQGKTKKSEPSQKVYVTNVVVRRLGEAKVHGDARVKLRVVFEDGSEEVRLWDGQGRWERFVFEKASRAKWAQVDPELIWLIDSNLANNSLKIKPGRTAAARLGSRALFWLQNFLHLLSALS